MEGGPGGSDGGGWKRVTKYFMEYFSMMWSQMLTTPQHKKAVLERRRDKEAGRERERVMVCCWCIVWGKWGVHVNI